MLLGNVPTYLCLLFIVMRFAVLLMLEIRRKWFNSLSNRAGETNEACLIGKPELEHIRMLLNPGLNRGAEPVKWYMRLLYCIYKPRPDFKFSTQLISTLVVCGIILFKVIVILLDIFDYLKKVLCSNDDVNHYKDVVELIFGSLEGAFIVCSLISVLLLLHFMKCHRDHVLQLYRGQRTFYQDVFVSPAKLVGRSLRFSGYQIAYALAGYIVLGSILAVVCVFLALIFKYAKQLFSSEIFKLLEDAGVAMIPTVGMAFFLWVFQWFLALFVFRDRDFPNVTITVDNRRLFSIMSYFFFFYNILLGLISCFFRILKGMALGVIFLSRIDRTCLMQGFQTWDPAFVAYLGFVNVLVAHSHPVMLMFCQLLLNRNKRSELEESLPRIQTSLRRYENETDNAAETSGLLAGVASVTNFYAYTYEPRLPLKSQKAVNRWHVVVMLLRNPSIIKYRRQGVVTPVVNLGSINAELVAAI